MDTAEKIMWRERRQAKKTYTLYDSTQKMQANL